MLTGAIEQINKYGYDNRFFQHPDITGPVSIQGAIRIFVSDNARQSSDGYCRCIKWLNHKYEPFWSDRLLTTQAALDFLNKAISEFNATTHS